MLLEKGVGSQGDGDCSSGWFYPTVDVRLMHIILLRAGEYVYHVY
jgi:hypothetical protein